MPKNTSGGSGHKKRKNKDVTLLTCKKAEDLVKNSAPEAHEYYAVVERPLGGRRFLVECQTVQNSSDLDSLNVKLSGACRNKITNGTFVLVQRFPFNLKQGGIVQVYSDDDIATLKFAKVWDFPTKKIKASGFQCVEESFRIEDTDDEDDDQDHDQDFIDTKKTNLEINIDDNQI
jgi:translation initiation factor IF-1